MDKVTLARRRTNGGMKEGGGGVCGGGGAQVSGGGGGGDTSDGFTAAFDVDPFAGPAAKTTPPVAKGRVYKHTRQDG